MLGSEHELIRFENSLNLISGCGKVEERWKWDNFDEAKRDVEFDLKTAAKIFETVFLIEIFWSLEVFMSVKVLKF